MHLTKWLKKEIDRKQIPPGYQIFIAELYEPTGGGKSTNRSVRCIDGQCFAKGLDVVCSRKNREEFPLGTRFIMAGKIKQREGTGDHIYTNYNLPLMPYSEQIIDEKLVFEIAKRLYPDGL